MAKVYVRERRGALVKFGVWEEGGKRHQAMIGYASPEEAGAIKELGGLDVNNAQLGALIDAFNWIRGNEGYGPEDTRPCLLGVIRDIKDEDAWQEIDDQISGR